MAISLKKTNVVIVGLGAVGGVAALPLARAGLEVIGLEAGTWLTQRDLAPDELRNNVRAWPQAVQKANNEVPTHRPSVSASDSPRPTIHPMMNAVGGTSLHDWPQSWRLNPRDFKVVSDTTRRYGASRIPKGSTMEDWPFGLQELEPHYDKVEYELGMASKRGTSMGRSTRAVTSSRGRASASIRCLRSGYGVHRPDGDGRAGARVARVPRAGRNHFPAVPGPADRSCEHEHVRQGAAVGLRLEGVRQAECRPLEQRIHLEDDTAVRGQTTPTSIRR